MLVVATPETRDIAKMVDIARTLNPDVEIVLRAHNESEAQLLQDAGLGTVFISEQELASGMGRYVLTRFGHDGATAH
jgi:CPA2 family monovalent cation:H+ antiporter-2